MNQQVGVIASRGKGRQLGIEELRHKITAEGELCCSVTGDNGRKWLLNQSAIAIEVNRRGANQRRYQSRMEPDRTKTNAKSYSKSTTPRSGLTKMIGHWPINKITDPCHIDTRRRTDSQLKTNGSRIQTCIKRWQHHTETIRGKIDLTERSKLHMNRWTDGFIQEQIKTNDDSAIGGRRWEREQSWWFVVGGS